MRIGAAVMLLHFLSAPCWALFDGLISGAKTVKDEAHKRIIENQMIQLIIAAKKNYDASVKIYREVKRLNEGRGLVRNIGSDLERRGKVMVEEEKEAFQSDFAYRGDSGLDRALEQGDIAVRRSVEKRGLAVVNRYADGVDKKSEAYAKALKGQAERFFKRKKRGQAGREEGVKIADKALDLGAKAAGLELQELSDSVEVLQEMLALELSRDAKEKKAEIVAEKEIAEALKFLSDKEGMAKALKESFYLVRLSRAPGLFYGTRLSVSRLAGLLIGLLLAAGFLYEFSTAKGFLPELLGLPLVLVIFGLVFYDKAMVSFAVLMDTMEQTVSSGDLVVQETFEASSKAGIWEAALFGSGWLIKYVSLFLGYLTWMILIVFLWVRFAFFCLLYSVGPLMIVCALFKPLRTFTYGWMMAAVQVGLWGIFMRILTLVVMNSGLAALGGAAGGVFKTAFSSLVINLIFVAFSVICPYFTHLIASGNLAEKGANVFGSFKGGATKLYDRYQKDKKQR